MVTKKKQKIERPDGHRLGFVLSRLRARKKARKRGTGHLSWVGLARVESHPQWVGEAGGGVA